jgi:hypothetical protein
MPTIEAIDAKLKDVEARLQEVENYRNPNSLNGRMESALNQIDEIINQISQINNRMQSFTKEGKFAEIFTDEELKDLYMTSGLTTNDVKSYIQVNFNSGEDVSQGTVSNYINGVVKDLLSRSMLGRYFRYESIKKAGKTKQ